MTLATQLILTSTYAGALLPVGASKSTHLTHSLWLRLSAICPSAFSPLFHTSLVFAARSFRNLWFPTLNETQALCLPKGSALQFHSKTLQRLCIKNVVPPHLFCLITKICREGTRVVSVTASGEWAALSRLISYGHKAAAPVFLAGGFTLIGAGVVNIDLTFLSLIATQINVPNYRCLCLFFFKPPSLYLFPCSLSYQFHFLYARTLLLMMPMFHHFIQQKKKQNARWSSLAHQPMA